MSSTSASFSLQVEKNNTPDNTQSVLPCRTNKALSCLFTIIPPQKKYNNPLTLNHQASKKQTKREKPVKRFCKNLPITAKSSIFAPKSG
ncbi:MAG: hypothetical protein ACI3Z6_04085 [Candidatus Onthomorpha sp.]